MGSHLERGMGMDFVVVFDPSVDLRGARSRRPEEVRCLRQKLAIAILVRAKNAALSAGIAEPAGT